MPLQTEHYEKRTLSDDEIVEQVQTKTLPELMELPTFERAEVLAWLNDVGARCKMKARQDGDLAFTMHAPGQKAPERWVVPGGKKAAKLFPLRAAIFALANRDTPALGGHTFEVTKERDADGVRTVISVPARPDLIAFQLVLDDVLEPADLPHEGS